MEKENGLLEEQNHSKYSETNAII